MNKLGLLGFNPNYTLGQINKFSTIDNASRLATLSSPIYKSPILFGSVNKLGLLGNNFNKIPIIPSIPQSLISLGKSFTSSPLCQSPSILGSISKLDLLGNTFNKIPQSIPQSLISLGRSFTSSPLYQSSSILGSISKLDLLGNTFNKISTLRSFPQSIASLGQSHNIIKLCNFINELTIPDVDIDIDIKDNEVTLISNDIEESLKDNINWQQKLMLKLEKWQQKNPVYAYILIVILGNLLWQIISSCWIGFTNSPTKVYEAPTRKSQKIGILPQNQFFQIIDNMEYYYKIDSDGITGWVSKRKIETSFKNSYKSE